MSDPASSRLAERRASARLRCRLQVALIDDAGTELSALALSVSRKGMCVQAAHGLTPGTQVRGHIVLPEGKPVAFAAEVRWTAPQSTGAKEAGECKMGLQFLSAPGTAYDELFDLALPGRQDQQSDAPAMREQRWHRLQTAASRMNTARDLSDLLGVVETELPVLLGAHGFSLYRFENFHLQLTLSTRPEDRSALIRVGTEPGPFHDAISGRVPLWVSAADLGPVPSLLVPLFVQGQLAGVLEIEQPSAENSEHDLPFYQAVAAHIGSALRTCENTAALEHALRDLQKAQSELILSERIAAVGKLAAGISHELKNPLTSMTFTVQNLRDLLARPELERGPLSKSLELLADDIRRMRDRVQTFLSLAHPNTGREKSCRADEIVQQVVARFRSHERAVSISILENYAAAPVVRVDEDQLFAAVSNLILNALEALGQKPQGKIEVSVLCQEQRVKIVVEDDGPGVRKDLRDQIFETFYTTKPGGTGLGLSQVLVFAERSGGAAWLADSLTGARFVIDLPESHP